VVPEAVALKISKDVPADVHLGDLIDDVCVEGACDPPDAAAGAMRQCSRRNRYEKLRAL
jgi:hypothetical protein